MFTKPPGNKNGTFIGISTVVVEDEPITYMLLPLSSCNGAGLLREVQRPDGQHVLLDYDALARRTRKAVLGT